MSLRYARVTDALGLQWAAANPSAAFKIAILAPLECMESSCKKL